MSETDQQHHIKEMLRSDIQGLQEENSKLKSKCIKMGEMENKIEMVLRQNSELIGENQKISKLLHEKKTDFEVLKNKYEGMVSHRQGLTVQNEFEKKKLSNEVEHLKVELQELEHAKNSQINEIKAQSQLEIQTLKRQNSSAHDLFEQEIRKLKDIVDKKDSDVSEQIHKYKRFSSDSEYELLRLKEEKEKLKNQLTYLEADHRKDIENLRVRLEANYSDQIQTLKRNHNASLENIQSENVRLKEYLENRGSEVEELNARIGKQKHHFEDTIMLLKKENDNIRMKMIESQKFCQIQVENLKIKLGQMHEGEMEELKYNHQHYVDCLQNQIVKIETILKSKNEEIDEYLRQKTTTRQNHHMQVTHLKEEIEDQQYRVKDLQAQVKNWKESLQTKMKEKEDQIQYLEQVNQQKEENHEKNVEDLKQLIQSQKRQLFQEKQAAQQKEEELNEAINSEKDGNQSLKDKLQREKAEGERKIQDLKKQLQSTVSQLTAKISSLNSRQNVLERENDSLKNNLQIKEKECLSLKQRIQRGEQRQDRYQKQIEDVRVRMNKKDQKGNDALSDQKKRLENSFNFMIENIKNDHQKALRLEQKKNESLLEKIEKKDKEVKDLMKTYKKMRDQFEELSQQEATRKQLTLKYPGATGNLIATKNLFDVYLKTKVLDVCEDAMEKQNRE